MDAKRIRDFLGRLGSNRDEFAALAYYGWGALESVPAHCVKDQIYIPNDIFEGRRCVINDWIHSKFTCGCEVHGRDGADHVGAALASKLNGKVAYSTGSSMNENPLTFCQLTMFKKTLPGGKCRQRNRRALDMVKGLWFGCKEFFLNDYVIGRSAVPIKRAEGVDFLSNRNISNIAPNPGNYS